MKQEMMVSQHSSVRKSLHWHAIIAKRQSRDFLTELCYNSTISCFIECCVTVCHPTRFRSYEAPSLLDLVFTNEQVICPTFHLCDWETVTMFASN